MLTEVAQDALRRQVVLCEVGGSAGNEYLAAVSDRQQTRDAIYHGPEVVAISLVRVARVHRHSDAHAVNAGKVFRDESTLRLKCRGYRIGRRRKSSAESVAHRLENIASPAFDGGAHERIVACKGDGHRDAIAFPAFAAAFDIREQQRDGTGWPSGGRRT